MIDNINKWMEKTSLFQKLNMIYVGGLSSEDKPDSPSLVHKLYSVMPPSVVAEGVTCSIEKPQMVQADILSESQALTVSQEGATREFQIRNTLPHLIQVLWAIKNIKAKNVWDISVDKRAQTW